jgi:hypothetical protein
MVQHMRNVRHGGSSYAKVVHSTIFALCDRRNLGSLIRSTPAANRCPKTAYGQRDAGVCQENSAQRGDGSDRLSWYAAGFSGMREANPGSKAASGIVGAEGFPFYEISAAALEGQLGAEVGPAAIA